MQQVFDNYNLAGQAHVPSFCGERRTTDRVISLWKGASDKQSVLLHLGQSRLWEHCFLLVVDDIPECSVIIHQGGTVAKGLSLGTRRMTKLEMLPTALGMRMHSLALECRKKHAPCCDDCEIETGKESKVLQCRFALVPLATRYKPQIPTEREAVNLLGVFTYREKVENNAATIGDE